MILAAPTRLIGALVLTAAFGLHSLAGADGDSYLVTDLGTLGGKWSNATDINDAGQIVGASNLPDGNIRAFLYSDGTMRDLGGLGGTFSGAAAINRWGQVTGAATLPSSASHMFLYSDGVMQDLTPDAVSSYGNDINDQGQIVGGIYVPMESDAGVYHAFLYSDGIMTDISPSASESFAFVINNRGQIILQETVSQMDRVWSGYLYDPFESPKLTRIPPSKDALTAVIPSALNDRRQVVGSEGDSDQSLDQGFIFSNGITRSLALGANQPIPRVQAINNSGQIIGLVGKFMSEQPFVATDGKMVLFKDLDVQNAEWKALYQAMAINNLGQMVGSGVTPQGLTHAYLLTPVPNIAIRSRKTVRTTRSALLIKGSAKGTVVRVQYRVKNGRFRVASGKASWRFRANLRPGRNVIAVRGLGRMTSSLPKKIVAYRR